MDNSAFYLILAGGIGERLWPLSTIKKPKQLLCLFDEKSLLRHTFERLLPLTDATHIYVSTAKSQKSLICKELPEVPLKNIFVEPIPKNTAAAIGYCATCLSHINENAMMVVLPADHYISDETKFQKAILSCFPAASKKKIVTMGIVPNAPETNYGYIKVSQIVENTICPALCFKEKPDEQTAVHYLMTGQFLWNSGIYIFSISTIESSFKQYMPSYYQAFKTLSFPPKENEIQNVFASFNNISIDYGIMEKAQNIDVLAVNFGWSDVGNFLSYGSLLPSDHYNNHSKNSLYYVKDSSNNIIALTKKIEVSLLGVDNLLIAFSGNRLLVCNKNEIGFLREVSKTKIRKK